MVFRAPLLGYNTNVRHKSRLYHIQTEDSGIGHPHVITHLFADGGRIVASRKTAYAEHLSADNLQEIVKKLMQAQHKAMFIALRDGTYDEPATEEATGTHSAVNSTPTPARPPIVTPEPPSPVATSEPSAGERKPVYQSTVPAVDKGLPSKHAPADSSGPTAPTSAGHPSARQSIFGSDLLSEKSLDEVILSYLATDESD